MSFPQTNFTARVWSMLTVHGLAAWLLISSMGCGFAGPTGPPNIRPQEPNVVSLDPDNWYIFYSAKMPAHPAADPAGAWSFNFPSSESGGHVNYVQTPFNATTALHNVTITFQVQNDAAQYVVIDTTDHLPATFRLFFEQQNDNLSDPNGRWWAQASMYDLGSQDNQTLTISVPLTSDQWTNVVGQQDAQAFSQALENIGWVGLTFGGQYFAGHGVAISSGSAKYILIDYSIN
jgi:hypothetical protein